ncbi:MAG: type II toxin-antitoxin system VapB family antitoxin [Desulfovibrionaceae bacterium]|jgi:hypothetical protein|nr:type II toxin-antitoxin system VapB family antitoxin [Desulfovibrionaceae bacterium]
MALTIKDPDTLHKIDHLSRIRGTRKVDVLRAALKREYEAEAATRSVRDLLAGVLAKADSMGQPGALGSDEHKRASDEDWGE